MVDGADDSQLVGVRGKVGQEFGDLDARHPGGDGLEEPTDVCRRLRLHIPQIDVAWSSAVENQDDGLGLTPTVV
jgi:hypothetical protein